MKNVIQWLKTQEEPDQGIVFLASPEAKYYWLNKEMFTLIDSVLFRQKKVQVVKDQEKAQSEKRFPLQKTEVGKNQTNNQVLIP